MRGERRGEGRTGEKDREEREGYGEKERRRIGREG
jgi:hypothetical protein